MPDVPENKIGLHPVLWIVLVFAAMALLMMFVSIKEHRLKDISHWQVYTNTDYALKLSYPKDLPFRSGTSSSDFMGTYLWMDIGTSDDVWTKLQQDPGSGGPLRFFVGTFGRLDAYTFPQPEDAISPKDLAHIVPCDEGRRQTIAINGTDGVRCDFDNMGRVTTMFVFLKNGFIYNFITDEYLSEKATIDGIIHSLEFGN